MTKIHITTPYYEDWVEFNKEGKAVRTGPVLHWVKQQGWDQDRMWAWAHSLRSLGYLVQKFDV